MIEMSTEEEEAIIAQEAATSEETEASTTTTITEVEATMNTESKEVATISLM